MALGLILGVVLGLLAGVLATYLRLQKTFEGERSRFHENKSQLDQNLAAALAERNAFAARIEEHKNDIQEIKEKIVLEIKQAQLKSTQESSEQLVRASKQNLENLLSPFQLQLKDLHEKIHKTYDTESRERLSLQEQIKMMAQVHEKMTVETSSLTKALRGEAKLQGDWGEITLRRVLEASGLSEGLEYQEQGKGFGLRDDEGTLRKPDFLILLPEERHLIVDSKVVLSAYEGFVRSDDPVEKAQYQKDFMLAVNRHIDDLSKKDYSSLHGIKAPDFTMMFLPTDGAFALALQSEEQLHFKSWQKKVILTSPSLLLPILRTVEFMWRQDKQGKNADKIADSAGKLYDKFVGFVEDLDKVRSQISNSEKALDEAFSKLRDGRGNLVSQTERLRKLGAKVKKRLPEAWLGDENEIEVDALDGEVETPV